MEPITILHRRFEQRVRLTHAFLALACVATFSAIFSGPGGEQRPADRMRTPSAATAAPGERLQADARQQLRRVP